jgi:hypothetical protein
MISKRMVWLPAVALALVSASGCEKSAPAVSYQRDVAPILDKHCKSCHMPGQAGYVVSGFELSGYESLMKGTQFGPVVLPGDPLTSVLVMLIEGRVDPAIRMPHGEAQPMSKAEIGTIRNWVEQGAKDN